jgi:L-ascorbate metabolism protein UlaG (beta-lactamase superfamily)
MTATTEGIHWLGHDSFRIDGSVTVYVDPWKLGRGMAPADIILITHDHYDHLSAPDIKQLAGPDTVLVGPAAVTSQVRGVETVTIAAGATETVRGVTVRAVPAYNTNKFKAPGQVFHPREAGHVGYVIELDGRRIYHAGDTDAIPEMAGLECDVALLPVSGVYVMTAEEAATACGMISAHAVVPMHYGTVAGSAQDAERLRSLCSVPVEVLPDESA